VETFGEMTLVSIADTGCGIEEKNMSQLFKPFFTTKDIGQGTGLGLATSFRLVQSWGGSINASSKVNQGSTFKVRLLRI
jgi:signal transduction histidine kinase